MHLTGRSAPELAIMLTPEFRFDDTSLLVDTKNVTEGAEEASAEYESVMARTIFEKTPLNSVFKRLQKIGIGPVRILG
jgi:hypothetical protein